MMPSIAEYYVGKNIFLTGGTGFIGKVLIEKILRSCPDVANVYCLVRPKKGKDRHERVEAMTKSQVFDILRKENPAFVEKITPINGDVLDEGVGICEEDMKILANNVNIVIHSAATIKFDEHLRVAVTMNILGVRRMIQLCRSFSHLESFIHVSTAYANVDHDCIREVVYPAPVDPQKLIDAIDLFDDDTLTAMTPKLIGAKPNTYTYTKQLAEALLIKEASDLPLAIVRPSIVTASIKEPMPGWVDNLNGPSGLFVAYGKGLLRTMIGSSDVTADIVPVDHVVNLILTVGWHTAVNKPTTAIVYNHITGSLNPVTWGDIQDFITPAYSRSWPLDNAFRRPTKGHILTSSRFVHNMWVAISHMIPAYAADALRVMVGKKPRMVNIYSKLHKALAALNFATSRSWDWTCENMDMLNSTMSPGDRQIFPFNPRDIDWRTCIRDNTLGTKLYILKEDTANIPQAKAHLRKLMVMRYTFNVAVAIFFWWLLKSRSTLVRSSWHYMMALLSQLLRYLTLARSFAF